MLKYYLTALTLFIAQFSTAHATAQEQFDIDLQVTVSVLRGSKSSDNDAAKKVLTEIAQKHPEVKIIELSKEENQKLRSSVQGDFDAAEYAWIFGYKWTTSMIQDDQSQEIGGGNSINSISTSETQPSELEAKIVKFIQGLEAKKAKIIADTKAAYAKQAAASSCNSSGCTSPKKESFQIVAPSAPKEQIAFEEAVKTSKVVIVYLGSKTCGTCRMLYPHLQAIEKQYAPTEVKVIKIDGSGFDSRLATYFKFGRGIPEVRVYQKGKLVASLDGSNPELFNIDEWIGKYLK